MSFDSDFIWQRRFIPHMKQIVGEHLITEASAEEDMHHNTDLVVLRLEAIRVACRVRRPDYLAKFAGEFTIRASRPHGQTELAKVLSGWGDYILYGFADSWDDILCRWTLGDLNVFRLWHARRLRSLDRNLEPGTLHSNGDQSSTFRAFTIADLPLEFIVASVESTVAS
jgi:hypothetical protein